MAGGEAADLDVGSATREKTSSASVALKLKVLDADVVEVLAIDQSAGRAAWSNLNGTPGAVRRVALGGDFLVVGSEADLIGDLNHGTRAELNNGAIASRLQSILDRSLVTRGDTSGRGNGRQRSRCEQAVFESCLHTGLFRASL